jgi:NADPH:quinone reductase-like Zn-dependent oxidoreductase
MRAVVIREGDLEVDERPIPDPGLRDVVVAVHAAGLNAADLLQRQGFYPAPPGWPVDIPGMELAGVVSAVGSDVDEPLLGRRVCALVGGGAQAEHCAVPAEHLIFVPEGVSWLEAGGFAEAFCTAHDALVSQAHLDAGERVLVSGAAGGVGLAAVQIAHALGAHVVAVTRTSEHHHRLTSLGADETITSDEVAAIEPVDVVLELVGAANLAQAQKVLATFARVVVIGVGGGGGRVELDLLTFMGRRATLTGSTLRSRSREEKADVIARVRENVVPWWTSGRVQMPIARSFELSDVSDAYAWFAQPGKFGKVVLHVEE